jgi:hypothetical protein
MEMEKVKEYDQKKFFVLSKVEFQPEILQGSNLILRAS